MKSLERYIILNAIDRLWQEHLYAMDALREGVYLRAYAQKDPLIEYKAEAYDMFIELMANIKNEVLHNLFRSTSNLQAFENFLATLPQFLLREHAPTSPTATRPASRASTSRHDGQQWRKRRRRRVKWISIFPSGGRCRKSAATNRALAAAGKNTKTAAVVRRDCSDSLARTETRRSNECSPVISFSPIH